MRRIFYNPTTLEIKGMSEGELSMEFPYVDTDIEYHSTENLKVEIKNDKPELIVTKFTLD